MHKNPTPEERLNLRTLARSKSPEPLKCMTSDRCYNAGGAKGSNVWGSYSRRAAESVGARPVPGGAATARGAVPRELASPLLLYLVSRFHFTAMKFVSVFANMLRAVRRYGLCRHSWERCCASW